ncbi:MAG: TraR/DksA C4-type zinc finger protein [Planctomycetes bacterium]|nr:TraR/DksA C4-type zinc finger protein [Planctomycetota bacterium]MCL4729768.1 TraR/DksA C4-type zinc finger protein [Planctomycetota bacterium]
MAKKAAKKAAKPAKRPAAKPAKPAAKKAKAAPAAQAEKPAVKVSTKGVLIRLKRPADKDKKAAAAEVAPNRSFNEKSKGQQPITLHHRKPTKQELAEFKEQLLRRRAQLIGDVKGLEAEAFSDETQIVSTNHLADSSFEQYEQEFNLSMIENETEELKEIGRALDKIEDGKFGICESCGIDISIERLRAMPYTRICIHCRSRFEEEGGGKEFGVLEERRV